MTFLLHDPLKIQVANIIKDSINKTYPENADQIDLPTIYQQLSYPPDKKMGDIAFAGFPLAKALRSNPAQIITSLLQNLEEDIWVQKAHAQGPYLNFFINTTHLAQYLIPKIDNGEYFKTPLSNNPPKTIIEFSQPNTHKEMHVGHMRNLCLGDAFIKIHRYCDFPTHATTFPGDVGTHVAKCLWYYKKHNKQAPPEQRKGAWLGSLYTKANNLLKEQIGSDHEAQNRQELTQILKELHDQKGEYYKLWKETRDWSIELMQGVYDWADVKFDSWYWESDVDADSVALVKKYQDKGLFKEDQGAVGIDLSDEKLGFCILLKSDGTGLYATKDIELARRKFEDHKVEKSIYVVDNRQSHHFKQVFSILDKMGFENAKNCYHLQYEMVELPDGAMSSRKGNIVGIQSLIDEMVLKIKNDYLNKYQDQWPEDEIDQVANIVAAGAIKYGMTRIDANKKIVFDMGQWLKLDGESGPYIQYVYARINSMLKKIEAPKHVDYNHLKADIEKQIILKLNEFNSVVQTAVEQYKVHLICAYLYDLAKLFNSFYAECPVANAEDDLKAARYDLCRSVALTLKQGLGLLGIQAPHRM